MANTNAKTEAEKAAAKAARDAKKADDFKRLGAARVEKALDSLAKLRGLSNKNTYTYTPEQVAVMFGALNAEIAKLTEMFSPTATGTVAAPGFSFEAPAA